jgi:hypothetical protein
LAVVNPHARELRFLDHQTRTRRDATRRASRAPGRARVPPGARFIAGLVDAGELVEPASTTSTLGGQKGDFGVALGAHTGPIPGGNRPPVGSRNEHQPGSKPSLTVVIDSETHIRSEEKPESYVPARRRGASSLAARAAR